MAERAEVTTKANPDGDGYILSGEKTAVEAADVADLFLVTASYAGRHRAVPGPASADGVTIHKLPQFDLGRLFSDVSFRDVRVPASAVLGTPGSVGAALEHQFLLAVTLDEQRRDDRVDRCGLRLRRSQCTEDRYSFGRPARVLPGGQAPAGRRQAVAGGRVRPVHGPGPRSGQR